MNGGDSFTEKDPTKDEVHNWGELDKNTKIGGIVYFECFEIKNARDGADDSSYDERKKKIGRKSVKIKTGDCQNDD